MKRICFYCFCREEWELVVRLVEMVYKVAQLQIITSNRELACEIENTGFEVDFCEDLDEGLSTSRPDVVVVVGNSTEVVEAAKAAQQLQIKVAHIEDIDSGQMIGDVRFNSSNVGALSVDNHRALRLLSQEGLEYSIFGFKVDHNTVLVNYTACSAVDTENLLKALSKHLLQTPESRIIITKPKGEYGDLIREWARRNEPRTIWFKPMGTIRRLSILQFTGAVIGNSLRDELDAPIFQTPYFNIEGLCEQEITEILSSLKATDRTTISSPHHKPNTANQILTALLCSCS